jgi:hydrogenase maturation protease
VRARVIGLGQEAAGDDGVGFAVIEELRRRGVPDDVELLRARDATALVPLLETPAPVVIVDAVLSAPAGRVMEIDAEDLSSGGVRLLSSHGLGVGEIVALARLTAPERTSPSIRIVAITTAPPAGFSAVLSSEAAGAVTAAAGRILELVAG